MEAPAGATAAEWRRFLAARRGDETEARKSLTAHLEWRQQNLPLPDKAPRIGVGLPDFTATLSDDLRVDGCRVLVVFGAMYDAEAGSSEEYARALASLFDTTLDRESTEKFTVLIDARGGNGWPNPRPWSVVPWIRVLASTLSANFPERLHRMIIFPVHGIHASSLVPLMPWPQHLQAASCPSSVRASSPPI